MIKKNQRGSLSKSKALLQSFKQQLPKIISFPACWMFAFHCSEWCLCRLWHQKAVLAYICWKQKVCLHSDGPGLKPFLVRHLIWSSQTNPPAKLGTWPCIHNFATQMKMIAITYVNNKLLFKALHLTYILKHVVREESTLVDWIKLNQFNWLN